ncbi:AI-2E family transporter [Ornithinimicrobium tianjinense]|uniref:AI-2E family transporter n=1 Tax=Ornithinimicrobium tianjinense TaxID=1195761 RepID=A0A917BWC9_9MICO|nr:AI-2E family transporter [Ornithinimicrobium tianjinense]GGF59191.1 AI-2E family transporter [Ornithinimicrobium tianjinense]
MPLLPALRRRARTPHPAPAPPVALPPPPVVQRLPRAVVVLLGVALAMAVLLGMNQLRDYIAPLFLALNLVLVAAPLQSALTRAGLPRWLGALVAGTSVFAFLVGFFYALGWSVTQMVQELPGYQQEFEDLYRQGLDVLARFGIDEDAMLERVTAALNPEAIIGALGGVLGNVGGALGLLGTTLIIIFFLMVDSLTAGRRIALVGEQHPRLAQALVSFADGVRRYWVVTTVFGLIVAVLDVVALVVLGVPLALAWGVLAFITNYIPNVGFVIGLVPPALMALLANGPMNALVVVIVYTVLNFVVQTIIQPKFTGDAVGVGPTVTFLSLVVWAWVLGPVGALLALPATLLVKALLVDADPQARWANAFLAADPETARAESTRDAVLQNP